uniref:DNA/RNA non-specific endonuclease domain-containing protein n=1 Tax=Branchiostoma floridae TaxID=7739 RepID=C3Z557_BRAFL|eukprot:XP_002596402.1 hypothetical protein BRAFLDRAFT_76219 [Branchiostoma floridae]
MAKLYNQVGIVALGFVAALLVSNIPFSATKQTNKDDVAPQHECSARCSRLSSSCDSFFVGNSWPKSSFESSDSTCRICQTLAGGREPVFATAFNTHYRIPEYTASAITRDPHAPEHPRPDDNLWERVQLVYFILSVCFPYVFFIVYFIGLCGQKVHDTLYDRCDEVETRKWGVTRMSDIWKASGTRCRLSDPSFDDLKESHCGDCQGLDSDYSGCGTTFNRGHINPNSINNKDADVQDGTFSMINVAPQDDDFNQHAWQAYERAVGRKAEEVYKNAVKAGSNSRTLYVITGTKLGEQTTWMKGRVAIPGYFWKALCYPGDERAGLRPFGVGFYGPNIDDSEVTSLPLDQFEAWLYDGADEHLFPGSVCAGPRPVDNWDGLDAHVNEHEHIQNTHESERRDALAVKPQPRAMMKETKCSRHQASTVHGTEAEITRANHGLRQQLLSQPYMATCDVVSNRPQNHNRACQSYPTVLFSACPLVSRDICNPKNDRIFKFSCSVGSSCDSFFVADPWPKSSFQSSDSTCRICQTLAGGRKSVFATAFNTHYRIPEYTASAITRDPDLPELERPSGLWDRVQLGLCGKKVHDTIYVRCDEVETDSWGVTRMSDIWKVSGTRCRLSPSFDDLKESHCGDCQGLDSDYSGCGTTFNRGHINPNSINNKDADVQDGTFSMINAAPQVEDFNQCVWQPYECAVGRKADEVYKNAVRSGSNSKTLYVITGTKLGRQTTWMNGRVAIPAYFWKALCYPGDENAGLRPFGVGFYGPNIDCSKMTSLPLDEFEAWLYDGADAHLFPGSVCAGPVDNWDGLDAHVAEIAHDCRNESLRHKCDSKRDKDCRTSG